MAWQVIEICRNLDFMSYDKNGDPKLVMHNQLARYSVLEKITALSLQDQRVIAYLIATGINNHANKELPEIVEGSVTELAKMCGLESSGNIYKDVRLATERLMETKIRFKDPEDGHDVTSCWIYEGHYWESEGRFKCLFPPTLRKVLTDLHQHRTEIDLKTLLGLGGGAYALRLYQIAKSWQSAGGWTCGIDELKNQLGVKDDTFKKISHLKSRVLDYSIKAINEKSDIKISYVQGNRGRAWTQIKFVVSAKTSFRVIDPKKPRKFEDFPKKDQVRAWAWLRQNLFEGEAMPAIIDWDFFTDAQHQHAFCDWIREEAQIKFDFDNPKPRARRVAS